MSYDPPDPLMSRYSAPEILKGDCCDEKIDMWALGCVLFVLLSGDSPFYGSDCQARSSDNHWFFYWLLRI